VVTELKAYKMQPMKQVMPPKHAIDMAADIFPLSKHIKLELADVKREPSSSKLEPESDASASLPVFVRQSSGMCSLVPLASLPRASETTDATKQEYKLTTVLADDVESCSTQGVGTGSQPALEVDDGSQSGAEASAGSETRTAGPAQHGSEKIAERGVALNVAEFSTNSAEATKNDRREIPDVDAGKKCTEFPIDSIEVIGTIEERWNMDDVERSLIPTTSSNSHSVEQSDTEHRGNVSKDKAKLASPRHIAYLEDLLSV